MNKQKGFTLVELLTCIAIIGVLGATALPFVQTWRDRARGTEAAIMIKQILDGEIAYFLENEKFYPTDNQIITLIISNAATPAEQTEINNIKTNLKIDIPIGHQLDYSLRNFIDPNTQKESIQIIISSSPVAKIFSYGFTQIIGTVNEDGSIDIYRM